MTGSFTDYARIKINEVHRLSARYNGEDKPHTEALLTLVEKHAKEIKELYDKEDTHFSIEVGDLLILCLELLIEQGKDIDGILDNCYSRYKDKLIELLEARGA